MSLVGENIARATSAGIRAAELSGLVHCEPGRRDAIRAWLRDHEPEQSLRLLAELEDRWRVRDRRWAETGG